VETGGDANVLFLNIPQFPVLALEQEGFTEEYSAVCPDCKLTALAFTVPQLLAGEHIAAAVSEFQKDPSINFVVTGFGDMLLGMPDALSGAGIDVPAISQAGTPLNYELIVGGNMQRADVALPTGFLGWRAIDAGLRALAGQDTGTFERRPLTDFDGHPDIAISGIPLKIIEADDIDDPTVAYPGIPGYQDLFKSLWGI
jgi:ribose transport system substrate-binding protein